MGVSMKQMASIVITFGVLSFILGVVAENKKPAAGTPITSKDGGVICKFGSDPSVALGYLSVVFLIASALAGYMSLFYPYKGQSVPQGVLFKHSTFIAFFNIALATTGLALVFLLWPTITEQLHLSRKFHHNPDYDCPTAKTGLLGGGAFLSLDSCLLWVIALMLAGNAREDFLDENDDSVNGELGKVSSDVHVIS